MESSAIDVRPDDPCPHSPCLQALLPRRRQRDDPAAARPTSRAKRQAGALRKQSPCDRLQCRLLTAAERVIVRALADDASRRPGDKVTRQHHQGEMRDEARRDQATRRQRATERPGGGGEAPSRAQGVLNTCSRRARGVLMASSRRAQGVPNACSSLLCSTCAHSVLKPCSSRAQAVLQLRSVRAQAMLRLGTQAVCTPHDRRAHDRRGHVIRGAA